MPTPAPLHTWSLTATEAVRLQRELADRVRLTPPSVGWQPRLVAGVDVTPTLTDPEVFTAGVVVLELPGLRVVETATADHPAGLAYVPGLLSFREGPAILAAVAKLTTPPDAFVFDGQGVAHPRRLGLASHLGLWLERPSLGCAKTWLCSAHSEPGPLRGDRSPMIADGQTLGYVLRTRDGVAPVYVSAGHLLDADAAVSVTLAVGGGTRIPEPTRLAHLLVNRAVGRLPTPKSAKADRLAAAGLRRA